MFSNSFLGLLNNAALLLALGVVYDSLGLHTLTSRRVRDLVSGTLVGLLALVVMSVPWELKPGVFFDTRWILISLCGLFFGPRPTLIAMTMAISYRFYQGGEGMFVGSLVILSSGLAGMVWRHFIRRSPEKLSWLRLYLFGLSIELLFLACILLMPAEVRGKIFSAVAPTVLLVYPLVSLLMSLILRRQQERRQAEESLQASRLALSRERGMLRSLLDAVPDLIFFKDSQGAYLSCNQAFSRFAGCSEAELIGKTDADIFPAVEAAEFRRRDLQALNTNAPLQFENWVTYPDHRKVLHDTIKTPLHDDNHRLLGVVGISRDITARHAADELIWRQANYDTLTGLPNRSMLKDRLDRSLRKAHRSGNPLALLFIDLDGFKEINDTLGHALGDELLKQCADRLQHCVRETDTVARISGDEFTIVLSELPNTNVAERVARSVLDEISRPFQVEGEAIYITTSIGITLFPKDADNMAALMRAADQAMYQAKRDGRNRFHYFTPAMQDAALRRMLLTNELRLADVDNHFQLLYQPIVELASRKIYKTEALLRWHHPEQGQISPMEFVPIAEDTGLIVPIGDWVFTTAATQLADWRQRFDTRLQVSVNCSPVQFHDERHDPSRWQQLLHSRGLDGSAVVVEITEGLLMDASDLTQGKLHEFAESGIQVALDDFGTGYSSMAYLKRFDIDFLKIDRAFVRNLTPDSNDLVLCEAMIVMAHRLGIRVIAEGIETEQQLQLLRDAGCDFGQGYLFSPPIPADEFEALLEPTTIC